MIYPSEPAQITLIVATGGEKEGDSMELLCQATGVPKPSITWRRSGKPFPGDTTVRNIRSIIRVFIITLFRNHWVSPGNKNDI